MPDKGEFTVEGSQNLPIDGLYIMTNNLEREFEKNNIPFGKSYIRFEKGIAYYEDMGVWENSPNLVPGKVLIKDVKKINEFRYSGLLMFEKDKEIPVTILVDGNNLKINDVNVLGYETHYTLIFEFYK